MRLYHNPISTCSQKVRMVLHEKGLAFEDTVLDLQQGEQFEPGYQALNPNAVVPTLEDQGSVMIESTLINEYLDDAYPTKPLKPVSAVERHQMRLFCKCIDDASAPRLWCYHLRHWRATGIAATIPCRRRCPVSEDSQRLSARGPAFGD